MSFHTPFEIIENGAQSGMYRMSLSTGNLLLRGGMAGAYIAMGAILMVIVSTGVTPTLGEGIARLIMGMVFPLGLILIFLTGAELFTGDAMLAPFAACIHKSGWRPVIRLWILSYMGNLIGALGFAGLAIMGLFLQAGSTGFEATPFAVSVVAFASEHCSYPGIFPTISCFFKAIIAGWLINLGVLLALCAEDAIGKIAGIWFPAMTLAATGLEHSITNICLIPSGLVCGLFLTPLQVAEVGPNAANLGWSTGIINNLIPSSLGNLVGGFIFAGLLLWISFQKEMKE